MVWNKDGTYNYSNDNCNRSMKSFGVYVTEDSIGNIVIRNHDMTLFYIDILERNSIVLDPAL